MRSISWTPHSSLSSSERLSAPKLSTGQASHGRALDQCRLSPPDTLIRAAWRRRILKIWTTYSSCDISSSEKRRPSLRTCTTRWPTTTTSRVDCIGCAMVLGVGFLSSGDVCISATTGPGMSSDTCFPDSQILSDADLFRFQRPVHHNSSSSQPFKHSPSPLS